MDNFVICYGMDEGGSYYPLSAPSSPALANLGLMARRYSIDNRYGPDDIELNIVLPGVVDGVTRVFVHGLNINFYSDEDGFYPLGQDQNFPVASTLPGFADGRYMPDTRVLYGGADAFDWADGYIGQIMGTMSKPLLFMDQGALPTDGNIRFAGGYIELNKLFQVYDATDPASCVRVEDMQGIANPERAYMQISVVYSIV